MKLITNDRSQFVKELIELQPNRIVTFSQFDIKELATLPIRILSNTQGFEKQKFKSKNWIFKTNKKVHAKFAIGAEGLILGSWNFSDNSTQEFHESAICVSKTEEPEIYTQLCAYFESLWERSTKTVKWNDEYT